MTTNSLITKTGRVIKCECIPHDVICKREFGYDLTAFLLKHNGCRVMIGRKERIAIEYHNKLSAAQGRVIRRILAAANYYTVVLTTKTIEKFRPIRSIQI